jgi:hypothetical protein
VAPIDEVSQPTSTNCVSLRDSAYNFALGKPDPSTLRLGSTGWSHEYRVKPSVLMSVGVSAIEPTGQIANPFFRQSPHQVATIRPRPRIR